MRYNDALTLAIFEEAANYAHGQGEAEEMTAAILTSIRKKGLRLSLFVMAHTGQTAKKHRAAGVPVEGDIAFAAGWQTSANPHDPFTVEAMRWISDWWRANADAFEAHVHSHEGDDLGNP